jgi:hypothetical protein
VHLKGSLILPIDQEGDGCRSAGLMYSIIKLLFVMAIATVGTIRAQSANFTVEGRPVQIHGFASQSFLASDDNNYLTMSTSAGSFAFTDFGANISVQLSGKFRVGAQFYDRNLGQLGDWHPTVDWASGDYRFKDWLGIRAGKVKTVLGLYGDTQDLEFLQTWALLPQSIYPLDLRASTVAHIGGDCYGDIALKRLGSLSYTAYAGLVPNDPYGGYIYGLRAYGINLTSYGGREEGGDLRWNTPIKGLLAGASYMNQAITGRGTAQPGNFPDSERSRKNETSQFYVQYVHGGLRLDGEYRRLLRDELIFTSAPFSPKEAFADSRSFYGAASYRISKRLEIGAYYSRFYANWEADLSSPANHIFDKVATMRLDLTSHWDVKIEGHFMNGYADGDALRGFYVQDNAQGFKADTNLLVIRTGIQF